MVGCLIIICAGLIWLGIETNWLTIRLPYANKGRGDYRIFTVCFWSIWFDLIAFYRDCFEHAILATTSLSLIMVFSAMAITGRFWFEDNWTILYFEMGMSISIFIYALNKLRTSILPCPAKIVIQQPQDCNK